MTNTEIKTNNPPKKRAANIQVDKLRTFEGHPFKVQDDEDMDNLTESIRQQGTLSSDGIYKIMSEEKANQTERISFKVQNLRGFFPKNFTQKQMTDTILKLLYDYNRKLERSRDER